MSEATSQAGQAYRYAIARGGFEITNGPSIYNRPLYGPHCDDLASFDERLLAVAGDSPDALLLLINWRIPGGGGCAAAKLGHLFLGIGDTWLNRFQKITARYVSGRQEYELEDPSVSGIVRLSYVRPVAFEGLLARVRMPAAWGGRLTVAFGGPSGYAGARHYDYQMGMGSEKDFHPEECEGSEVSIDGNSFSVRKPGAGHRRACYLTATVPLALNIRDASAHEKGPRELSATPVLRYPMLSADCGVDPGHEAYLVITTTSLADSRVQAYLASPALSFESCCRHYEELSRAVRIETPDPCLDLGFSAQILALDGSWHDPCFTHGPWSWATPHAGWRICYGPTVLGWHDRVEKSVSEFFKGQAREPEEPALVWQRPDGYVGGHVCRGAVPDVARESTFFYNMGEVLVDHILHHWQWTGDLEFMKRAFDFVAGKLRWEERLLDPDADGLYENWLNTWISDAHWYNGGGCIQASAYNWRANLLMADVARCLGKDPASFEERAARIARACKSLLWVAEKGVYAEYKDAVGRRLLHPAPEQASIYHPIEFGMCDELESYQMLRYALSAFTSEVETVPRGGRLLWSSNWLPVLYSSLGLYPQETLNLMLCLYRIGRGEEADELLRGVEAGFLMGPCPGALAHNQRPDGTHFGSTDFTDTSSMFVRTVVEGLFGIRMNLPEGAMVIRPCFPRQWQKASIEAPYVSYDYRWDGRTERIAIRTPRALDYRVRLRGRGCRLRAVRVNEGKTRFSLEAGIGHPWIVVEVPAARRADIEVHYQSGAVHEVELPAVERHPVAAIGERCEYRLTAGTIAGLFDPQGVARAQELAGDRVRVTMGTAPGPHTFFVQARSGQATMWLPVDVELRPAVEIVRARLCIDGFRVRCACRLANNSERETRFRGVLRIGGARRFLDCAVPEHGQSEDIDFGISNPESLTPGSNRLEAELEGDPPIRLSTDVVAWDLAVQSSVVKAGLSRARTIDLGSVVNEELALLHTRSYLEPRPRTYSIMVKENARSIWDWNLRGFGVAKPCTERLSAGGGPSSGLFHSDIGVPFAVPATGRNAVFASMWDNFPTTVTIPIGLDGRKLYMLMVASTNPMQSRMENARVTVTLDGGEKRFLPLVNPDNLDDWLCEPFAKCGYTQWIGDRTHASILDMDLGAKRSIHSMELECICNEVLVGIVGVTVV